MADGLAVASLHDVCVDSARDAGRGGYSVVTWLGGSAGRTSAWGVMAQLGLFWFVRHGRTDLVRFWWPMFGLLRDVRQAAFHVAEEFA